jgi:hypothetical protein
MEHWKDIKGYEGLYQVSNYGRVKALPKKRINGTGFYIQKERIMSQQLKTKRYYGVNLTKDGIHKNFLVHRLVADAFIKNPNNYEEVNHIDCNKLNNKVENLEWCTREMNLKHALENELLLKKKGKKLSKEECERISKRNKGRIVSKETREKISRAMKEYAKKKRQGKYEKAV